MDSEEHIPSPDTEWGVPVVLSVVLHVCVCTHKSVVCVFSQLTASILLWKQSGFKVVFFFEDQITWIVFAKCFSSYKIRIEDAASVVSFLGTSYF